MSLIIWFYKNEVASHCSHRPSTHPERSSRQRSGMRHSVLWEKLAEQAFRYIDIFRRFYEPSFLHLLISRKTLKSLTETSTPRDEQQPSCNQQQPSAKMCAWLHVPPSPKITYTLTPTPLFRAVPQSYLRGCLLGYSSHCAPNKT